jgi:hypothetical protein
MNINTQVAVQKGTYANQRNPALQKKSKPITLIFLK